MRKVAGRRRSVRREVRKEVRSGARCEAFSIIPLSFKEGSGGVSCENH